MKTKAKTSSRDKKVSKKNISQSFPGANLVVLVLGIIVLSHVDGMGHHSGHTGLFFLMLALIARPISCLWKKPLRHRRSIGIFAFAATLTHAIYAFLHILDGNLQTILDMTSRNQWGIWAGIVSLTALTPAAITSFPSWQRKLGKRWRQIHLLTLPALALATFHTILIGPHYMAQFQMGIIDYLRIAGITTMSLLVFVIRKPIFWSILGFKK